MSARTLFRMCNARLYRTHAPHVVSAETREQGQAIVEFAFTIGIFVLLMFGLIGLTVVFFAWLTTASAARDGTRFIVGNPSATDTQVRDYICSTTVMLGGSSSGCSAAISAGELVITVEPGTAPKLPLSRVTVTVRYRVPVPTMRASFLGTSGITFLGPIWVESSSVMRVE